MRIKYIAVGAVLLAACSSPNATTRSVSPADGSPEQTSSGSQTGSEGSEAGCRRISHTEIDAEQARALDFPVDEQLALFEHDFDAPFHLGNVNCSALPASTKGHIQIRASLLGITRDEFESVASDSCPTWSRERLNYRARIDLTTDDGTLVSSFEADAATGHPAPGTDPVTGLSFSALVGVTTSSGSLGIRVDPTRAHVAYLGASIALGVTPWVSHLLTSVTYTDGGDPLQDEGDGLFWPSDINDLQGHNLCGWLDYPTQQRAPISLDAYNAL
jgi:hypothetical protein